VAPRSIGVPFGRVTLVIFCVAGFVELYENFRPLTCKMRDETPAPPGDGEEYRDERETVG
jgi:hypothetical protein